MLLHAQEEYYPDKNSNWEEKQASDFGVNIKLFQEAVDFGKASATMETTDLRQSILEAFEHEPYHEILGPTRKRGGATGMIIKNGYVIAKWGDLKRVDMTFSVSKSYLSIMAGLAIDDQRIQSVDEKVKDYVWDGKFDGNHNSKITWKHLLQQTSDWTGVLWAGPDWADRPPKEGDIDDWKFRKLSEPGSIYEYNDVRVNLLAYSLLEVWRKPLPQVLKEKIMDPIGASSTWRWYGYENSWTNVDGIQMQSVSGGGHSGGGVFTNTEDQARLGLLFLRDGKWGTEQLLSQEWIKNAMKPSYANENYGYMWWLNPNGKNPHLSNISHNAFYAAGFGSNYIIIEPDHDLVVVLRWFDYDKANEFMNLLIESMK